MNPGTHDVREFTDAQKAALLGYTEPLTKAEFELMRVTEVDHRKQALAVHREQRSVQKQLDPVKGSTFMPSPKSRFKHRERCSR